MVTLVHRNLPENGSQARSGRTIRHIDVSKGLNLYSNGILLGNLKGRTLFLKFEEISGMEFDSLDNTMRIAKKGGTNSDWVNVQIQDFLEAVEAFNKFGEPQLMSASNAE